MPSLFVFGSINVDYVAPVSRLPGPGETIKTDRYEALPGGKGANQALAAARNGAATTMVGAVGDDGLDGVALSRLDEAGVSLAAIRRVSGASGLAMIAVDAAGENQIIVVAGANAHAMASDLPAMALGSVLVTQNEVDWAQTAAAHAAAQAAGATVVHNAAPAHELETADCARIDVLVVNEHELAEASLGGGAVPDASDSDRAAGLLARGVGAVLLTLGAKGAILYEAGKAPILVPAAKTTVIDTTGAGDGFVGAFAAALAHDPSAPLADHVAVANAYAARVCAVMGAQTPLA
ncbi:MAG: ribokinase [Alphaproteobacteria bacterium]